MSSMLNNTIEQSADTSISTESGRDVVLSLVQPIEVAKSIRVILSNMLKGNQLPKTHLRLVRMSEEAMYRLEEDKKIVDRIQPQVEGIVNSWQIIVGGTPEAEQSRMENLHLLMRLALHKYVNVESPHTTNHFVDRASEAKTDMSDGAE